MLLNHLYRSQGRCIFPCTVALWLAGVHIVCSAVQYEVKGLRKLHLKIFSVICKFKCIPYRVSLYCFGTLLGFQLVSVCIKLSTTGNPVFLRWECYETVRKPTGRVPRMYVLYGVQRMYAGLNRGRNEALRGTVGSADSRKKRMMKVADYSYGISCSLDDES